MQTIIYPTELRYADSTAMLQMDALKNSFLEGPEEKIFKYLQRLPDILKNSIKKAQEENPERCKRELVTIRCEALLYYNLDDIPYWQCNMLLFKIKPELKYYISETERIYNSLLTMAASEIVKTDQGAAENDILRSTIDDWLLCFKEEGIITDKDYNILACALMQYFKTGAFPTLNAMIKVGKVNKKRFGWALNQLYRMERSEPLSIDYLLFAKVNISLFEKVDFDVANPKKGNFYKYFTTET